MADISSTSAAMPAATTATSASTASPPVQNKAAALGKNDFLKLLMAQMQNQDPLKPMDDTQMVAQMAQFSALEATQNLSSVLQKSANLQAITQTGALVGKYVEANQADGTKISGVVSSVSYQTTNGVVSPQLMVGNQEVGIESLVKVGQTASAASTTGSGSAVARQQATQNGAYGSGAAPTGQQGTTTSVAPAASPAASTTTTDPSTTSTTSVAPASSTQP